MTRCFYAPIEFGQDQELLCLDKIFLCLDKIFLCRDRVG